MPITLDPALIPADGLRLIENCTVLTDNPLGLDRDDIEALFAAVDADWHVNRRTYSRDGWGNISTDYRVTEHARLWWLSMEDEAYSQFAVYPTREAAEADYEAEVRGISKCVDNSPHAFTRTDVDGVPDMSDHDEDDCDVCDGRR